MYRYKLFTNSNIFHLLIYMTYKNVLIIMVAIIILYIVVKYWNNTESFLVDIKKINKSSSRDHSILDDPLFGDVKEYQNDDDGRLGIDKCLENCKGNCLEFGVTGIAYCFPRDNPIKANYNTTLRSFDNETDDVDRAASRMTYPGLR